MRKEMNPQLFTGPVVLLVLLMASVSCSRQDTRPPVPDTVYLALGDSYTIGQGVQLDQSWPIQLSEELISRGFEVENTEIIARTGWTTADLLSALENRERRNYNLVSLLIGVNNQYQNRPFEQFTQEFDLLLTQAEELATGHNRVFVVSIPDYGVTPFGNNNRDHIARDIDKYNAYIQQTCATRNIRFVDVTKISRELGDSPGALAPDRLHPSTSQYALWVERMLPLVIAIIKS